MATALEVFMPYDSGPGSNTTEDGWRQMAQFWRGDGVIRGELSEFAVLGDSTGMQVKVPSGRCWIKGNYGHKTTTTTLPIAAAHATLGRRDLVILRNNFLTNLIELDVLTGTPASSPTYPVLTQNTSIWEIQLGKVVVDAAVVTIAASKVTTLQTFVDGACSYTVDPSWQLINPGTITKIDWDNPQFDTSAVDRSGLNSFILRRSGMWMFSLNVVWADASNTVQDRTDGNRNIWIALTSDTTGNNRYGNVNGPPNVSGHRTAQNTMGMHRFNAGDAISAWCFQSSGGNLNVMDTWNSSRFEMFWLGA